MTDWFVQSILDKYGITDLRMPPPAPPSLPRRPRRHMPQIWTVASYWHKRGTFAVDLDDPHCFRCGFVARCKQDTSPRCRWNSAALVRAHLYDRWAGGLDGPQNIVPLCSRCHGIMPMFLARAELHPIDWVLDGDEQRAARAS